MSFLIILIASTIELVVASCEPFRSARWITDWFRWLSRVCGRWRWWDGVPGVALTIGAPAALIALMFNGLAGAPVFVEVGAGVCLLLLTFGPEDLDREIEAYLRTYSRGDADVLPEPRMSFLDAAGAGSEEAERSVLSAIAVAAHDRVFASLFWFALLGPVGPVIHRMTSVLRREDGAPQSFASSVARLHDVLVWAPARLFVLGLGLAGTLTPTLDAWRERADYGLRSSEPLLRAAAVAAVNYGKLEHVIAGDPHVYWINLMQALVKRTFTLWLALLAVVTLVAL